MTQEMRKTNLAVLGSGFMGTSILKGLVKGTPGAEHELELSYTACVRSEASLNRLRNALGDRADAVHCQISDFTEAANRADIVMLGVPPGELDSICETPGLAEAVQGKLTVSLLAGVSCTQVVAALSKHSESGRRQDFKSNVARVIPTIAAQVKDSITLIAESKALRHEQQQLCNTLFEQIGATQLIPEDLMNEATATGAVCHAVAILAVDAAVALALPKVYLGQQH